MPVNKLLALRAHSPVGLCNVPRRYAWGQGVDQPVLRHEGGALSCAGTRFLHTDHQGSIIATADCPGNRLNVNSYDDYGVPGAGNWGRFQYSERPRPARGGWPTRAAQAWLPELGMYSYKPVLSEVEGARIYSPQLGAPCCPRAPHAGAAALMQTDPIGYEDQMNLYAYVANDPVNRTDPSGKAAVGGAIAGALIDLGAQVVFENKSLDEVDWGDVAISAALGATGTGLANVANKALKAERAAARAQNVRQAAQRSSERARGPGRQQRAAAQDRRAQAERRAARSESRRAVATGAAAAAAGEGAKRVSPPVTTPKDDGQRTPPRHDDDERRRRHD